MNKSKITDINIQTLKDIKCIYEKEFSSRGIKISKTKIDNNDVLALNEYALIHCHSMFAHQFWNVYNLNMYGITWALTKEELEK